MDTLIFVRKRLIHMIPVLFGILLVVFLMVRLIPGDPARIMLGTHATEEKLTELRATLGLDQPIYQQFCPLYGQRRCAATWALRSSFAGPWPS